MFFWIGGGGPLDGPFCVHAAQASSSVAAGVLFVDGPAATEPDDETSGVAIVGQVFTPGVAQLEPDAPAATTATTNIIGVVFTPGVDDDAGQMACEDD